MEANWGKYIILFGVVVIVIGLVVYFFGDKLHWFGNLPGDIRMERENFKFYFPLTTMILLSLVLTLLVNVVRKFF